MNEQLERGGGFVLTVICVLQFNVGERKRLGSSLRYCAMLAPHSRAHGLTGNLAKCETCQEYASTWSQGGF
jgi:hypothetical protein